MPILIEIVRSLFVWVLFQGFRREFKDFCVTYEVPCYVTCHPEFLLRSDCISHNEHYQLGSQESFILHYIICHTRWHGLSTWTQPQVVELRAVEANRTFCSVGFAMHCRVSDTRYIRSLVPCVTSAWMQMSLKHFSISRHKRSWNSAESDVACLFVTIIHDSDDIQLVHFSK